MIFCIKKVTKCSWEGKTNFRSRCICFRSQNPSAWFSPVGIKIAARVSRKTKQNNNFNAKKDTKCKCNPSTWNSTYCATMCNVYTQTDSSLAGFRLKKPRWCSADIDFPVPKVTSVYLTSYLSIKQSSHTILYIYRIKNQVINLDAILWWKLNKV